MWLLLVEQEKNREVFLSGYSTLILFVCVDLGHAYDEEGLSSGSWQLNTSAKSFLPRVRVIPRS